MVTLSSNSEKSSPSRNLIALCLASFVVVTGFGVILPFFPLYAKEILFKFSFLGLPIGIAFQIGIMTSAFMFTRFLLAPSFGDLSDVSGRKPIILVGMSIYTFLLFGFGLAFDFLSLLVIRALQGVASAAVWPVGEALIVDTSTKNTTGRNLGYYIMSMQAGMAAGPFIGFIFYAGLNGIVGFPPILSYRLAFICQGIMGVLATVIVALLVKDPSQSDSENLTVIGSFMIAIRQMGRKIIQSPRYLVTTFSTAEKYRSSSLYTIYLVAIINGFGNAMIFPIIALFLDDYYFINPEFIALVIGIIGILALSGNPLGGTLSDKLTRKHVVWISGCLRGGLYLVLGIQWGLFAVIAIFAIQRFLWAIYQPAFRAMQSELIPEAVRGKEFGIVQALFNFGSVLGPIIGGVLYDNFLDVTFNLNGVVYLGAGVTFVLAGILGIIGSITLLLFINSSDFQESIEKTIQGVEPSVSLKEK
ncbi:MAG: MFS transporter [Candidatus Heimdallarchaeota archaeon]|nr:MAG: MFS transporter [Candidatus Heimdallarchaeota archaeon]